MSMITTAFEDLRGRHFVWQERGGAFAIVEDPVVVGQVTKLSDRPAYLAEIAGERLLIHHSVGVLGPTFEVRDTSNEAVLARSRYTSGTEMRAMFGDRAYRLRGSSGVAIWNDGAEDAVSLRSGEAFVLMGADPNDAAPLLLLGIVMSLENSLVPTPQVRGL